ncbi:MAG: nucleoside hydrolase, partial [Treponema sp.]|jgi:inosine-uridine nucleoside N-ribohydrolase|nr:nucleoside hydrolase [Treponema sp.]
VDGNQNIESTTDNTLRVVDLLRADIPVYKGCHEPLIAGMKTNRQTFRAAPNYALIDGKKVYYHAPSLPIQEAVSKVRDKNAVTFLVETLLSSSGDIVLVPVGPLTNIAAAMRCDQRIIEKIKRIVLMGGGWNKTNKTSAAEFNIWKDPEAAQIVFTSGCDITVVPLDATHDAFITSEESEKIRAIGTDVAVAVADFLNDRILVYDRLQPQKIKGSTPPHDALALCSLIDPEVLRDVRFCRVDVDFGGGIADGMTVVDHRAYTLNPPNVHFAFSADRERFAALLYNIVSLSKGMGENGYEKNHS